MRTVVLYDSAYGNTEAVAQTIAKALRAYGRSKALLITNASAGDLREAELVIVGSPTQGGRPTTGVQDFIKQLNPRALYGIRTAAFDTRFAKREQGRGLRLLMGVIGFAAPKIASLLKSKGGVIVGEPQGFIVGDTEGPLRQGELERAAAWARTLR